MKIRTGDIYRIETPKYKWINQFSHGRILNITFGKYLDYTSSKILLENNLVDEIWNIDLSDSQEDVSLRKLNAGKITYELKNKKEIELLKFDTIIAFNILSITDNIDETLKLISQYLEVNGSAIISIINNDNLLNHTTDLITKDINLFSKNDFKNKLELLFNEISFFSQGTVRSNHKRKDNISMKLRIKIKDYILGSSNRFNFYRKYLKSIHKPILKINKTTENKKTKRYQIMPFKENSQPMFTIAKCKK
jgi:hypothetical protein